MDHSHLFLAYDVGTTGCKTCLYGFGDTLVLLDAAIEEYPLNITPDGGAEQKTDDWWSALCRSTRILLSRNSLCPDQISALSFCCQMQGLVLVDKDGNPVRNPMIYLDARSKEQIRRGLQTGIFKISGMNAFKLLRTLRITGGVAATPKDPLWKYHWVRQNEPRNFEKAYKWLDVKDYLVLRCTGRFSMTRDSANITFLYDTRPERYGWHLGLCRMFGVYPDHLPDVMTASQKAGGLTSQAALELGLSPDTPVFAGGGDVPLTTLGSGCVNLFDTHIYVGTSGWVVSNVDKRLVDINNFMASILGAMEDRYCYVGEQETSGACLAWVRDHLAMDEIGIYLRDMPDDGPEGTLNRLYELLNTAVEQSMPGAGGAIFTPWLHGNRTPREDANARGMFFNIGMGTGKKDLIRSVLEGVAFHKRWMLEAMEKKIPYRDTLRFVGGGARSGIWCQIMADITGRHIETIANPQDAGAAGAALVCARGLGLIGSFNEAAAYIQPLHVYHPKLDNLKIYDRQFDVFKALYRNNKKLFEKLNRDK